jgi:hypothetical protein
VTTGQVNFCVATANYCTDIKLLDSAQLTKAGTAVFKFIPGPGSHSYQAVFAGTTSYAPSASGAAALTVTHSGLYPTGTTVSVSGSSGNYTLTAVVGGNAGTAPTGTVSFFDASNANALLGTATLGAGAAEPSFWESLAPLQSTGGLSVVGVADLNGDGIPDIVAYGSGVFVVLLGKGDGAFTALPGMAACCALALGDFNGDGIMDVVAVQNSAIQVFLGNGDGTFTPGPVIPEPTINSSYLNFTSSPTVTVGDFNGDGNLDLAVLVPFYEGCFIPKCFTSLWILWGNGDGTFTAAAGGTANIELNSPVAVAGDFNGDGKLDLAVMNWGAENVTILLGNGDGTFTVTATPGTPNTINGPSPIVAADFNGDGNLDLAVSGFGSGTLTILLGNGNGTFTAAAYQYPVEFSESLAVGDFNGDGIPDLANVGVYLGKGDGTFTASNNSIPSASSPSGVAVGDFNGDGISDIAIAASGWNVTTLTVLTTLTTWLTWAQSAVATLSAVAVPGTHQVVASYAGDSANAASTSIPTALTAGQGTPQLITWATPAGIVYGTALSAAQLNATSSVPGKFVYSPAAGTVLNVSPQQTLSVTFTPADTVDYPTAIASVTLAVIKATPAIVAVASANPALLSSPVTFTATVSSTAGTPTGTVSFYDGTTATVLGTVTLAAGVATYTTTGLAAGPHSIYAIYNEDNGNPNFLTVTSSTLTETIEMTPAIVVVASANPALLSSPVTFTATVSSTAGTPTGTVSFYDGTTLLGAGTLAAGVVTYTTAGLAAGPHSITAAYSGDANFVTMTSSALTETIEDFALALTGGGSASVSASQGGVATFSLAIDPPNGATFVMPVTFTVTGLPAGATAIFSPATITAGSGPTNMTLTVTLPSQSALQPMYRLFGEGPSSLTLGLILLPFVGRFRRASRRLKEMVCLLVVGLAGTVLVAGLAGCGGGGGAVSVQPVTYTLTITATSGSLSHSTTVNLTVE